MIVETPELANKYKKRSIAEQNSLELSWAVLQEPQFKELRFCMFGEDCSSDERRFRQLIVNSVMSTDLGDKELKALRDKRWKEAFEESMPVEGVAAKQAMDRKATIVIEHLIQASDVSHTMQHWDIYRQWNTNLFRELYAAYRSGRADKDPAEFWYEGEISFFDFYIIPLSKKLDECGVFGISSDENLNYALTNRELWVKEGQKVTAEMSRCAQLEWEVKAASNPGITKSVNEPEDDSRFCELPI